MRNVYRSAICCLVLLAAACHKRKVIEAGDDPISKQAKPGVLEPVPGPTPTESKRPDAPEWKSGSPAALVGNWASSIFQDQRCTVFYTFSTGTVAELNLVCLNAEKNQFEREFRRFSVAVYPGTQQLRFKPSESSCVAADGKNLNPEGASFLYALEAKPDAAMPAKLVLWEPSVVKTPLNLSKADGLLAEGFPGVTGMYLGLPVVTGCFTDGKLSSFQASTPITQ